MKRLLQWLRVVLIVLFSAGWLVPLLLAGHFMAQWVETDLAPRVYGLAPTSHGFPFLDAARVAFWVGCYWLVAVVVFWSVFLATVHFGPTRRGDETGGGG